MVFLAGLCLVGLAVLLQLPIAAIVTGIAALPLVVLYPLAKRVTWWPQGVLGLTFSWGVPLGWTAATGALPAPDLLPALFLVYAGSVAWVFGYDTIYAVQDMEDDRIVGVRSSALGLGRHLHSGVAAAYGGAVAGLAGGFFMLLGSGIWIAGLAQWRCILPGRSAALMHMIRPPRCACSNRTGMPVCALSPGCSHRLTG